MNPTKRRIYSLIETYKPGLILLVVILVLGWGFNWMLSRSEGEVNDAIRRVYDQNAQPLVCGPARRPPAR